MWVGASILPLALLVAALLVSAKAALLLLAVPLLLVPLLAWWWLLLVVAVELGLDLVLNLVEKTHFGSSKVDKLRS